MRYLKLILTVMMIFLFKGVRTDTAAAETNCGDVAEIPYLECYALTALYNSTDGPNWTDSPANNWNETDTI